MRKTVQAPAPPDDEVSRLRMPPHSIEAEQSVLGGLLLQNDAYDRVGDLLTDSDFYRHEHRTIYAAIANLLAANKPADIITVSEYLKAHGKDEQSGGLAYLNELAGSVPSAANIRRYAEIVVERALLRRLIVASDEIATQAFNPKGKSAADILAAAQETVFRLGELGNRGADTVKKLDSMVAGLLDYVQDAAERGGEVTGTPTGYIDLDKMTAGLQDGDLVVVGGRPSMGKSAFAMNIAEHIAIKEMLPVLVFSLEMSGFQLALRMVGSQGRINLMKLRKGALDDTDWGHLSDAVEVMRNATVFIDESAEVGITEIRARAKRISRQCGKLGLIVVDYMQLMSGAQGSEENRSTVLGAITRGLKVLAKDLQCPVMALSQLSRKLEERADKRPMMSDLRESGSIEQDADLIIFMYRDEYYNPKTTKDPGVAEVIIAKQRMGPTGTVKLAFIKAFARFENLAPPV